MLRLIFILLLASPSFAEEVQTDAPEEVPSGITLHITKRAQPLEEREVTSSLATLDREEIRYRSIERLSDFLARVPNVQVQGTSGPIAIRGIAPSQVSGSPGGLTSPVAQHVNGIFKPAGEISYIGQFFDLERLELIRGPSGTVYGRSATAGALDLRWRRPHASWEAFGDVTGSRPDAVLFRGGLNLPLLGQGDERLLARISLQRERADGFQDDPSLRSSRDPENADDLSARAIITSKLGNDFSAELRGHYHHSDALGLQSRPATSEFPLGALATPFGVFATDPFAGAAQTSSDPLKVRSRSTQLGDPVLRVRAIDGELRWRLPRLPALGRPHFTILGGWERREQESVFDVDGTELVIAEGAMDSRATTWTGEARIATDPELRNYHALIGAFAFQDRSHEASQNLTPFGPFDVESRNRERGFAVFASGGIQPFAMLERGPDIELFGGVRWNRDKSRVVETIATGPLSPGGQLDGNAAFEEVTSEAGLRWQASPNQMLYAKWARGYKPGLLELIVATGTTNAVDPEIVETFEIGTRSRLLGGRVQLDLTGFLSYYDDLQVLQIRGLQVLTENAAEATIWGIEASLSVEPLPGWQVRLSAAHLDATFDEFCSDDPAQFFAVSEPGCPDATPGTIFNGQSNLEGNQLQDAPRWKASIYTTYAFSLGAHGTLRPVAEFTWTDGSYLRPFNLDTDRRNSTTSTDLRLIWMDASERVSAEIFVENLGNDVVYARRSVLPEFAGGFPVGLGLLPPRRFGIRLGFRWGSRP
ncbi:MAG: TonB-dependent receptor [bacterium]|nr:TonB-dependent receptor [bacterium]